MTDTNDRRIDHAELARIVDEAARAGEPIPQLTHEHPLDVDDAYRIQELSIQRRLDRGEKLVGVKMGLTSRAKMAQVGVHEVIWGRLTDAMLVEDGGAIEHARYCHPRVEPEVAFLLKQPLEGPVTPAQALAACEAVAPALEVIDSRYQNFKFALPDVVADNSSSSSFVVGPWNAPTVDLANLGMVMRVDGHIRQVGSTAAILGHPLRSLTAASRLVSKSGMRLEAGWIVMAGGATAAVPLSPNQSVQLAAEHLGRCGFRVS